MEDKPMKARTKLILVKIFTEGIPMLGVSILFAAILFTFLTPYIYFFGYGKLPWHDPAGGWETTLRAFANISTVVQIFGIIVGLFSLIEYLVNYLPELEQELEEQVKEEKEMMKELQVAKEGAEEQRGKLSLPATDKSGALSISESTK